MTAAIVIALRMGVSSSSASSSLEDMDIRRCGDDLGTGADTGERLLVGTGSGGGEGDRGSTGGCVVFAG